MAKEKNKKNIKEATTPVPVPVLPVSGPKSLPHLLIISSIAIITWLFLQNCLDNGISTWDDVPYISGNSLVKNLSWEGVKVIFSTPAMGNYHPLTVLSYALEYDKVGLEPWQYHFDSLLLQILCTILVYWFVFLLCRSRIAALVTALLFGLHPMHVESVAWVAARKDVLYGAFYLGACILYIGYLRGVGTKRGLYYAGVLLLFICALLSKPVAVTLPLALLLIDAFEKRPFTRTTVIEKIPHFLLALIFGIVAIKVQQTAGAMEMHKEHYNIAERLALGNYALITYLWKAIIPAGLHCLYIYPAKTGGALPGIYYLYPIATGAIAFIVWKYGRRNKAVVFGLLFFVVNILLLLQFIPVGEAIIAERYSYLPYIGLFFIAGWYFAKVLQSKNSKPLQVATIAILATYTGILGYLSSERCKVWTDDGSLWRDEIDKEPGRAKQAYNNLGYIYSVKWAGATDPTEKSIYFDSATHLINKAIAIMPPSVNPYLALGELFRNASRLEDAKKNYHEALTLLPTESDLYVGLAVLYIVAKQNDSAGIYFRKVLQLKPNAEAHGNYANFLLLEGKNDSALLEYGIAISLAKGNHVPRMNRGIALKKMGRWDEAFADIQAAIKINPDVGEPYYHRSFCDTQQKNFAMALQDVEKAISLGYTNIEADYYNHLKQMNGR